ERSALSLLPDESDQLIQVPARLTERIYCGGMTKSVVTLTSGTQFVSQERTDQLLPVQVGDQVFVNWSPADAVVLKQ
ncbi:TOBE domain-containing protein, partial [Microbacteriaceae bacterium K1510]|nr:TOBE domain-containing protein [Microbacteriaceae bacterium K1510]